MVKDLLPGDPVMVGPYRLLGRLGAGGMGNVYLARSPGGRLVAVKVIRSELAGETGFRTRFAREVAAARNVSGMFTALVVDADTQGSVPWLATAYVAGPSLAEAVENQGPLPAESVLTLAAGLAEGLQAIHTAGVVHRDLKPSNVLLAHDGPRVIDFGISRAREASMLTQTGTVMGSPGFLSPEQAEGVTVGPPSDVFSLGAVLTFAATGEGPFGTGPTPALMYRVVNREPDLSRVPDVIRPLIERCLAKNPADRPTTSELLEDLGSGVGVVTPDWLPEPLTTTIASYVPTMKTPATPHGTVRVAAAGPGAPEATVGDGAAAQSVPAGPEAPLAATAAELSVEPLAATAAELPVEPLAATGAELAVEPAAAQLAAASPAAGPAGGLTPVGVEVPAAVEELVPPSAPQPAVAPAAVAGPASGPALAEPAVAAAAAPAGAVAETRAEVIHAPDAALGPAAAAGSDLTVVAPSGDPRTTDARIADPGVLTSAALARSDETGAGAGIAAPAGAAAVAAAAAAYTGPDYVGPPPGGPAGGPPAAGSGSGGGGTVLPLRGRPGRRRMLIIAAAAAVILAGLGAGIGLASAGPHKPVGGPSPALVTTSQKATTKPTASASHSPKPKPKPKPKPTHKPKPAVTHHPTPTPNPTPTYVPPTQPSTPQTTYAPPPTTAPPTTPSTSAPPGPQSIGGYSNASPYGCGAEESPTGGSGVSFTFSNQSGSNVQLYYYTSSGALDDGGLVPPESSRTVGTSTGYFWMVANASGGCINVFAIQGSGSVTVV